MLVLFFTTVYGCHNLSCCCCFRCVHTFLITFSCCCSSCVWVGYKLIYCCCFAVAYWDYSSSARGPELSTELHNIQRKCICCPRSLPLSLSLRIVLSARPAIDASRVALREEASRVPRSSGSIVAVMAVVAVMAAVGIVAVVAVVVPWLFVS